MAEEAKARSGKRFAQDLRRVRESRRLTVDDLHDETKIPLTLLETFEETALFDHPQFNRVYLRSFVRTYSNVVGIDPDAAIEALEEALSDRYSGSLGIEYLGDEADAATGEGEPSGEAESRDASARMGGASTDEDFYRDEDSESAKEPEDRDSATKGEKPITRGDTPEGKQTSPPIVSTTGETAAGFERSQADEGVETEWTMQSPPKPKQVSSRRNRTSERPGGGRLGWIAGVAAVIIVGVVVWIIISVTGNGPEDTPEMTSIADTSATADIAAVLDTARASRGPMPTLGDTLNVQIVAANDKADPIRVTVDDDLRRPYWIEQGDSMMFRPINRIVIEEDLDDIQLSIEGVAYPATRRDEAGRVVITRDSLRAYFGSNGAE